MKNLLLSLALVAFPSCRSYQHECTGTFCLGGGPQRFNEHATPRSPEILAGLAARDVDTVVDTLHDLRGLEQEGAVYLGEIGALLSSPERAVWIEALEVIRGIGPCAYSLAPRISELLSQPTYGWHAAAALGSIGPRALGSAPTLRKSLASDDTMLRAYSAHALGEIGDTSARADLARLMAADPSPYVQYEAREALRLLNRTE